MDARENKLIVSTVGTSLLTNLDAERRSTLNRLANHKEGELDHSEKAFIDHLGHRARSALRSTPPEDIADLSAELNGLYNVYKGDWGKVEPLDVHVFVGTDTYQGRMCTEILKE